MGAYTSGNRSVIIELNKGISFVVNLGKFTFFKAYKHNLSSSIYGFSLFKVPAATKIDFKALMPKS